MLFVLLFGPYWLVTALLLGVFSVTRQPSQLVRVGLIFLAAPITLAAFIAAANRAEGAGVPLPRFLALLLFVLAVSIAFAAPVISIVLACQKPTPEPRGFAVDEPRNSCF